MVDRAEESSLKELCLHDRTSDLDKGFSREDNSSFRDGPDVTCEFEVPEIIDELIVEVIVCLEELQIPFGEVKVRQIIDNLLDTCHYGIAAVLGNIPEECVEINDSIAASVIKITVCHGQLIEIREHAHVGSFIPHSVVHFQYLRYGSLYQDFAISLMVVVRPAMP